MFLKRNAPSYFAHNYIHFAVYLQVHITKKIKQHIEEECTMHTLPRLVSSFTSILVCVIYDDGGETPQKNASSERISKLVAIADSRQAMFLPARIYKQV
jgi:hypothetical protein